ncbi:hypothetical protein CMV_010620 [Castanea mollissima]|uniref:Cation/H+ exchanger domain-containing protein n=1 Tax=Castanea mollissima TaxID=60419 RepID=A0A8J4R3P6_9ROSI|nr:hypothetical protein CMV_010620 [Castanea mollissima]
MHSNSTTIKISSDGVWQGDNPLNYAFPLLIVQTTLVLFVSRFLAFLLKPLRQPKVIAEIIGGILLGPSALGRNKQFVRLVFPSWSTPILESVASIGLLFFLFLVGLELDLSSLRRSGKRAFTIALAGISLPFLFGAGITFLLRKAIHGEDIVGYGQLLMFMGVALSITAFPVLARILAELKLLTTQVGETAMAAADIKRIEDFVSGLLLPLYFASSGLKTDVTKIYGAEAWGLLVLVISTACAGKILGTFVVAMLCLIPVRDSLALGVLMNTKGLVELIVLNIGKEKKRQLPLTKNSQDELRVLACVHGPENVLSLINLVESIRNPKRSPLKLYVMHLVELTDRSSSIVMVQRARKNGFPFINRFCRGATPDQIAAAFEAYGQVNRVNIRHSIAISALSTMQEDVCHVAQEKRVAMIILPFHKLWRGEGEEAMENVNSGWRMVNQSVLKRAPCSVAVFVDRGFGGGLKQEAEPSSPTLKRVCILFFGGSDDREALELGGRMTEHPAVSLTILRFLEKAQDEIMKQSHSSSTVPINDEREKEMDETTMAIWRCDQSVKYEEKVVDNITEEVLKLGQSSEYELVIVGKGQFSRSMGAELPANQIEHAELGPIGNILASSDWGIVPSVLVIQQDKQYADETATSRMVQDKHVTTIDASITNNEPSV